MMCEFGTRSTETIAQNAANAAFLQSAACPPGNRNPR
jgi:hypothetical protein